MIAMIAAFILYIPMVTVITIALIIYYSITYK